MKLEEIGFNQVELVATGKQDIVVGYAANEPIQLKAQGIDVTELRVADYVQLASNGILASEKVIAEESAIGQRVCGSLFERIEIYNRKSR